MRGISFQLFGRQVQDIAYRLSDFGASASHRLKQKYRYPTDLLD